MRLVNPDIKTRVGNYEKVKLWENLSYECRCKNPFKKMSIKKKIHKQVGLIPSGTI